MAQAQGWINGSTCDFSQLQLPVWDLGVVAGASMTEMARTFAHKPFRLAEHLQRLMSSCAEIGFKTPYSAGEILTAAEAVVRQNTSLISEESDLGIVMFVTAGANPTYLGATELPGPTVVIHTFPLPFANWRTAVCDGVRLQIPQRRQIDSDSLPMHLKTRNRLHWWLADRDAEAIETGSRALLLDNNDFVTETSTACFFGVLNDEIVTPRQNVLNSMSRRMVEEAAAEAGVPFRATDISLEDVSNMSEAFLSSTPVGILPVKSVADRKFDVSGDSKLMQQLRAYWKQQTGTDPIQQILDLSGEIAERCSSLRSPIEANGANVIRLRRRPASAVVLSTVFPASHRTARRFEPEPQIDYGRDTGRSGGRKSRQADVRRPLRRSM